MVGLGCGATPAASGSPASRAHRAPSAPALASSASAGAGARSERAPSPVVASCAHGLELYPLAADLSGGAGIDGAALHATRAADVVRVWSSSSDGRRSSMAVLGADGLPGEARDLGELLAGTQELSDLAVAESESEVAVAAAVWRTSQDADIALAVLGRNGHFGPVVPIDPSPMLDGDPAIAAGPDGRFALVWTRGTYPTPTDIEFTLVDHGHVGARSTLVRDAEPEGLTIARTDAGYVVAYTPSSAGDRDKQGVYLLMLDPGGQIVGRHRLLEGRAIWPVAASDGHGAAIAFRWDPRRIGFARVGADGNVLLGPVAVESSEDPAGDFRPISLRYHQGLYWIGATARFTASVIVAAPSQVHVVAVSPDGKATAPLVLPVGERGGDGPALVPAGPQLWGVYAREQTSGQSRLALAAIGCRPNPPAPAAPAPSGPCDPRLTDLATSPPSRFGPVRRPFVIDRVDDDLAVASYERAPDNGERWVLVRMSRQGETRWTTPIVASPAQMRMAVTPGEIALAYATDAELTFATFDAATGKARARRTLHTAPDPTIMTPCLARSGHGYLVAYSIGDGSRVASLGRDGSPHGTQSLGQGWTSCGLVAQGQGHLLAFTHPGLMSETNFLYLLGLDRQGKALGAPSLFEQGFANQPLLSPASDRTVLVWTDALWRELFSVDLDRAGHPLGASRKLVDSYGLQGFGLLPDGDRPLLVWSSDKAYGEQRVCAP
jgi:hypothetical protein